MQGKMPRKEIHAKKKVKKKKFMQKVWVSEINNITRNNMNKQKSLSSYWKETIRTLFLF